MSVTEIELPLNLDFTPPSEVDSWLTSACNRIQQFQDRWDRKPIEQFVASDFSLVYQSLQWVRDQQLCIGSNLFCEWGCGFAVVSCLADRLGWDAIGIEAESALIEQARKTVSEAHAEVELVHGNFLPADSEQMADDPTLPSLGHPETDAYQQMQLTVDDFSLVFAYPWPGEGEFLEAVFEKHAEVGACFLTFCGPYQIRLIQKTR